MPSYRNKPPLAYYRTALPGVDYSELQGKLIVIEGPDAVGRSTQVRRLKPWLEEYGHAVLDTGMARSALAGKGIKEAKQGNTLGPITMTLYYATDFADRLENEIIPALRAGFVVLTDRYIFSIMARAIARGENRTWIERTAGFALVPHMVLYMRAEVKDLISRVVVGRGAFDYWESGLDLHFGKDMYESFVRYQSRLIQVFDNMVEPYGFETIDASQSPDRVFASLQRAISKVVEMESPAKRVARLKAVSTSKSALNLVPAVAADSRTVRAVPATKYVRKAAPAVKSPAEKAARKVTAVARTTRKASAR